MPAEYDPVKECTLASEPGLIRYLYCPGFSRGGGKGRVYCCGDLHDRSCCSAEEWQADQLATAHQERDPESREESGDGWHPGEHLRDEDMPGWAIALIVLGSLVFTVLVTYLICSCFWKLLCCCCCRKKKHHEEEKTVLIHHNSSHQHHHHQHSNSWPTTYNSNSMIPAATAPQLYYNVTPQQQGPPPPYEQQRLYPAL